MIDEQKAIADAANDLGKYGKLYKTINKTWSYASMVGTGFMATRVLSRAVGPVPTTMSIEGLLLKIGIAATSTFVADIVSSKNEQTFEESIDAFLAATRELSE